MRLKIQNETLVIVNVYAPTKDDNKSQKLFFEQLSKKLDSHIGYNILVGGDFNVCLNPDMDKRRGTKLKQSFCGKFIETMSEDLDLIDIWRVLNEDTKRFTWRSLTKKGRVSSRLDYWLITSPLLFDTVHTDIEPSIKTDHSLINLTF